MPFTTWSSRCCGAARLCGARCGSGLLRTVLIICGERTKCHCQSRANLFFPAWTVTREQWADMMMPSISGVAIDTLLFSRIGSPLCHRYRLISRTGSHAAFRGTYLRRLRAFLDESDFAVVRRLHHRLAQELASRVVLPTDSPASVQPRSTVRHRTVSQSRRPRRLKGFTNSAGGPESSCRLPA